MAHGYWIPENSDRFCEPPTVKPLKPSALRGSAAGLAADNWSARLAGTKLHICGEGGFYIWDLATDTLDKRYYSGGPQGLYGYTNSIYSSHQDPDDSDIVWIGGYLHWQKLSKTNGWQEFHRLDQDAGVPMYRFTIFRIGDQLFLGAQQGYSPRGYLV